MPEKVVNGKVVYRVIQWTEQDRKFCTMKDLDPRHRELLIRQQQLMRDNLPLLKTVSLKELQKQNGELVASTSQEIQSMTTWDVDKQPEKPVTTVLGDTTENSILNDEDSPDLVIIKFIDFFQKKNFPYTILFNRITKNYSSEYLYRFRHFLFVSN